MSKELNQNLEQAEGAQGERVVQTAPERIYLIVGADCPRDADFSELAEVAWCEDDLDDGIEYVRADKAHAALAQPSPAHQPRLVECDACPTSGGCVEVCMKAPAQAFSVPELEHIGSLISVFRNATRDDASNGGREYFEKASSAEQELRQEIDRIVGALRNELESERDLVKVLQEQIAALSSTAEDAQARVAELEKQEPVYTKPSWADNYGWSGGYIDFKCATDVERLARHFEDLLDAVPEGPLYAAPAAQAAQVPERLYRALAMVTAALEADGDRVTSVTALRELQAALATTEGKASD